VFLRAAKLVGVSNENSIVFEDSVAGIQAANIAYMTSVGIGDATTFYTKQNTI
jgi:beta-phosphoglucomutase